MNIIKKSYKLVIALSILAAYAFCSDFIVNNVSATPASLSLSISDNTISLNMTPTTTAGEFSSSSDITVGVNTTNNAGYKLSITANNSTNLVSGSNNLTTISSAITSDTFSSSSDYNNQWGYKPSKYYDTVNDTFVTNTGDNAVYLPSPNTTTGDIIDQTSTSNSTNNEYTISIGARTNLSTPIGEYSNTFTIMAIANATPYTITYHENGGDQSSLPANVNDSSYAETVVLSSTTPTRTGYNFTGWCLGTASSSNITTSAGVDSCSSTTYSAGGNLTLDQTANTNTYHLYAMWSLKTYNVTVNFAGSGVSSVTFTNSTYGNATTISPSGGTTSLKHGVSYTITMTFSSGYEFVSWATASNGTLGSTSANPTTYTVTGTSTLTATGKVSCTSTTFSGYMQSMSASTVTNACVGDTGTLTDRRDSKTYTVKKLADGKLWMTENLAIDLTATSYDTLYGTGTNAGKMTNATSEALQYLKGTKTGTSSNQWAMAGVKKTWISSYSYSQPWIAVDSSTSGLCYDTYCVNSDLSWSSTSVTSATINGTTSKAQGKIGVYYNYCAASAGSYCWGNGTSSTGSPSSDPTFGSLRDITSDICPYGWRLPTGGYASEYNALYTAYSSNATNFQSALVTPLSGHFQSGKAYYQGEYGHFWSSTWYLTGNMYSLYVTSSSVAPTKYYVRYRGHSVRCLLGS